MIDASPRRTKGRSAVTDAEPPSTSTVDAGGSAAERPMEAPGGGCSAEGAPGALFGVALLKLAVELKKPEARPFDELVSSVLTRMRLPEDEFRAFLGANGGLLKTLGSKKWAP